MNSEAFDCCCHRAQWALVADLGHAQAIDFMLGRCDHCGKHWMNLFGDILNATTYLPVTDLDAQCLLSTRTDGGKRKQAVSDWFDDII
jgi:hypothetical protein